MVVLSVYGRFFRIYLYIALAPIPFATFAGEPTQKRESALSEALPPFVWKARLLFWLVSFFSLFATTSVFPMDSSNVWAALLSYLGGVIFNMLILVGIVKMADRVTREMLGL